jgi:hypothetical protein
MQKILKAVLIIAISYLMFSTIIPINFAQQLQAASKNCNDCRPTRVYYCSKPLKVENENGAADNYGYDYYTETKQDCWSGANPSGFSDVHKVGQKSYYGVAYSGLIFSLYCAAGKPLDISIYDNVSFWFKSTYSSQFNLNFRDANGQLAKACDLGYYNATETADGWKEYDINLGECPWLTEKKPIYQIVFNLVNNEGIPITYYVDNLTITNQPIVEDPQYYFDIDKNTGNFDLNIKSDPTASPMQQYDSLEYLVGSVSAETNKKTIHVSDSSEFILHGNGLDLSMKEMDDFSEPVYLIPYEKCSDLVGYMLYSKLKLANDYVDNKYGITLKYLKTDASRLRLIYSAIMKPTGVVGYLDANPDIPMYNVLRVPDEGFDLVQVGGRSSFDSNMKYLATRWGTSKEGLAFFATDPSTGKVAAILDMSDVSSREMHMTRGPSLPELGQISQMLYQKTGTELYGDFVHSHPTGILRPSLGDVVSIGKHIREGYPYPYARLTIINPNNGEYKLFLLDRPSVELEAIKYEGYKLQLETEGLTGSRLEAVLTEHVQGNPTTNPVVYEVRLGDSPALPEGNKVLQLVMTRQHMINIQSTIVKPFSGIESEYSGLIDGLIEKYGEHGIIPDTEWSKIMQQITNLEARSLGLKHNLDSLDDTISIQASHDITAVSLSYRNKIDDYIDQFDDLLGKNEATPSNLRISPETANAIVANNAEFETALVRIKGQADEELPEVLKVVERMDPDIKAKLSEGIQDGMDDFEGGADAFVTYEQPAISKVKEYVLKSSKWIGRGIMVASIIGDALASVGLITLEYGKYFDDSLAIFWGNKLLQAGLEIERITIYITIGAMVLSFASGLTSLSLISIFGGPITGIIIGLLATIILPIFVNIIICALHPDSPFCGCSVYPYAPYNGKPKLELDHNVVVKGDTLRFTTHGMQYCYSSTDWIGQKWYINSMLHYHGGIGNMANLIGNYKKECNIEDGSCCEGSVIVDLDKGVYPATVQVSTLTKPEGQAVISDNADKVGLTVIGCNPGSKTGTDGLCHEGCGADPECGWLDPWYRRGHPDNAEPVWSGAGNISANQIRYCDGCSHRVIFDSSIDEVSVDGFIDDDAIVNNNQNIQVVTKVKNTGTNTQGWWFVGVEFYKVNDYNQVSPGNLNGVDWESHRTQRVDAWFNGRYNSDGCNPDIQGCGCSYSDPDGNRKIEPGETITVTCSVNASYWGPTTGNERIMFWVYEIDLGQDAGSNGNEGNDGWSDALAKSYRQGIDDPINGGPASVKVKINPLDTGLGEPIIEPSSLEPNNEFKIYCPTNGNQQYDCIDAYTNILNGNPVDQCAWITGGGGWVGNKAVFSCSGRVGTYTAVCKTRPTGNNCKPAQTEKQYSVYCNVGDTACCKSVGDINGNGKVDLPDIVLLANAYGSKPSDSKWNPNADINENGKVDLPDLMILANHYGFNCYS